MTYKRDKRSPKPKNDSVSKVMSRNKASNTKPEIQLRKALWAAGVKGYRTHFKDIPGRPDIVYPSLKLAIFVHGCFWHRCPKCKLQLPKNNSDFWAKKFSSNIARDQKKIIELQNLNWQVLIMWECEIKKREKVKSLIKDLKNRKAVS